MANIFSLINNWAILGRTGTIRKKENMIKEELDAKFGDRNWQMAHLANNTLLTQEEALTHMEKSYYQFFTNNVEILEWLLLTAQEVYCTDPSDINSGLDYSTRETITPHFHDVAIRRVLRTMGKTFRGKTLLQIHDEHSEGFILATGRVPFHNPELILQPQLKGWWLKNSIEAYWQSNNILAVKFDSLVKKSELMIAIILRKDIKMGKGKICAQAAHALVTLLPEREKKWDFNESSIEIWTVKTEEDLLGIYRQAQKQQINSTLIHDAGKTQIVAGTRTAVGIGPINQAIFDKLMCDFHANPLESKERNYRIFKNIPLYAM